MPQGLRRRGKIWWLRFSWKGQRIEESLATDVLAVAQERAQAVRREITGGRFGERHRTFDEAARRLVAEHFPTLRPRAAMRYLTSLGVLADQLAGVKLADIGSARLDEFERARRRSGVSTSTIRRDLACLSILMTLAEEWEWVDRNPVKPFLRARGKRGLVEGDARTRYLTIDEERRLLDAVSPVYRDAVAVAIDTGLRRAELYALEWRDVDLDAVEIELRAELAKSRVGRVVPLLPRAHAILARRRPASGEGRVFLTAAGQPYSLRSGAWLEGLAAAAARAGIADVIWHDLRRTCGCRLLQEHRLPMDHVSRWLGHSTVRVTEERYAFLRARDLHDALRRHGPAPGTNSGTEETTADAIN